MTERECMGKFSCGEVFAFVCARQQRNNAGMEEVCVCAGMAMNNA